MISDRNGLITRIRQVHRQASARDQGNEETASPPPDRLQAFEERVAHLEQQLEGLQDAVHRESDRHAKLLTELLARLQPGTMGAALAQDARDRGL